MSLGAIVLAGGRSSRFDGGDKPGAELEGRSLLARTVDAAVDAGASPIVVVSPPRPLDAPVVWAAEAQPFGGPASAVVAAFAALPASEDPEWTLLLACDLANPAGAIGVLLADLGLYPADTEGVCLTDASSRPQWLTGVYRTRALRAAASALEHGGQDEPARALMHDLAIATLRADAALTGDIDTRADLDRASAAFRGE